MVLLTSSAISVAISGTVICIFTFLLFLSGYVLQQQTVKSLQEALQRPQPPRTSFTAVLPFSDESIQPAVVEGLPSVQVPVTDQVILGDVSEGKDVLEKQGKQEDEEQTPRDSFQAHIISQISNPRPTTIHTITPLKTELTWQALAYILALPEPKELCSALLFVKWHRQFSKLRPQTSLILLYPSDWETASSDDHEEALHLLREHQDHYNLILHPVSVSKVWTGIDIESQLLSELARNPWPYDRAMYLRSPGMALDLDRLDQALNTSDFKTSWSRLKTSRASSSEPLHPPVLLLAPGRGMMTPKSHLAELVTFVSSSHENHHANEMDAEAMAQNAAYVMFHEHELEHRRRERVAYSGLFERFERDRREVCAGTGLLDTRPEDTSEIRRVRRGGR